LGLLLAAAGLFDASFTAGMGAPSPAFRFAVLGLLLPGAGLLTSRRYLWFRRG